MIASKIFNTAATRIRLAAVRAAHFAGDARGLAAVEFALIVPVMITLYFGTVETTNALTASRRVTSVAETAADLTAQASSLSSSDINDIFAASTAILTPFNTSAIKITITSVVASSSNASNTSVAWSKAYGGASARATNSSVTLPSGLTTAGSSVIMVEVVYTYTSPVGTFITGPITMSEVAYLKPRRSTTVALTS